MKSEEGKDSNLICVAEIVGSHGIKGLLKLKVFGDEPENLFEYNPLRSFDGKSTFKIEEMHPHKNIFITKLEGIKDRNESEKLHGTKLYILRDELKELEDEDTFYYTDLIGLSVKNKEGEEIGSVLKVDNFGAGDLLEIKPKNGKSFLLPFKDEYVPTVDIKNNYVTVNIPEGFTD